MNELYTLIKWDMAGEPIAMGTGHIDTMRTIGNRIRRNYGGYLAIMPYADYVQATDLRLSCVRHGTWLK